MIQVFWLCLSTVPRPLRVWLSRVCHQVRRLSLRGRLARRQFGPGQCLEVHEVRPLRLGRFCRVPCRFHWGGTGQHRKQWRLWQISRGKYIFDWHYRDKSAGLKIFWGDKNASCMARKFFSVHRVVQWLFAEPPPLSHHDCDEEPHTILHLRRQGTAYWNA